MSERPNTLDLDALEQLVKAMTAGEWRMDSLGIIVSPEEVNGHDDAAIVALVNAAPELIRLARYAQLVTDATAGMRKKKAR